MQQNLGKVFSFIAVAFGFATAFAQADQNILARVRVEVPVEMAFAPVSGFDDNDEIEVVLHGKLPNGCYSIADAGHDALVSRANSFVLHQFAYKSTDILCSDESQLPDYLNVEVPFTSVVSLGQLEQGEYFYTFVHAGNQKIWKSFKVEKAPVTGVDNLPYVSLANIVVPEYISQSEELVISLSGTLNSTCAFLEENFQIIKQGDVLVVLPVMKRKEGVYCAPVRLPWSREINLGTLTEGSYLIHIRNHSGTSVNRVVDVK